MKRLPCFTFEELYMICNKNDFFTCGSSDQYDKLFELNKLKRPLKELVAIIYVCSDKSYEEVNKVLLKETKKSVNRMREKYT